MSRIASLSPDLVADAVHHAADQQGVQAQADRPGQQRAALQPPRQAERAASARAPRCGGPGRSAISPAPTSRRRSSAVGHRGQRDRRRQVQQQHPPAVAGVRADLQGPAQRGQPRQRHRSRRRRRRAARRRPRARRTRCRGRCGRSVLSWAATAATAVNTRPEPASARPNASEPARGTRWSSRPAVPISPVAIEAPNASSQRGGQAGVPADGGGVEQLGAAGLLLRAGVPDDGQDDRDGDQRVEHAGLPDAHRAEAVVVDRCRTCARCAGLAMIDGRERRAVAPRWGRRSRCCPRTPRPAAATAAAPTAAARSGRGAGTGAAARRCR